MREFERTIAQNIRALRTKERLSHQKFAAEIGCSRTTAVKLEGPDVGNVRLHILVKASEYFGIRLDRLLDQDLSDMDELEWAIHQLRHRLSSDERDSAIGVIEKSLKKRRMSGGFCA